MEIEVKPYHKNIFPLGGILIKGTDVYEWLKEIQRLHLSLENIVSYPIPGSTANSVAACLVVLNQSGKLNDIGKNEYCQLIQNLVFISERSILTPAVSANEIEKVFSSRRHILHPEFGLVELTEEINWKDLIAEPLVRSKDIICPAPPVFIPKHVNSFQVAPVKAEDILKNLEENAFPKSEKLEDKPLNAFEQGKLWFYKKLFKKTEPAEKKTDDKSSGGLQGGKEGEGTSKTTIEPTELLSKLQALKNFFTKKEDKIADKMMRDYEELEKRNQKAIDRLMDMLKNNPEEALKYCIPLDNEGSSRGGDIGQLDLSKRWLDFSLSGPDRSGGSGGVNIGDHFQQLQTQYLKTAQDLINKKEFQKAAFIYMKLLKNYHQAGKTLEDGNLFPEAASVYLKYAQNKTKAAECFEKGSMTPEAIELYKELNQNEKVGDLYMTINKKKDAFVYFEKVVDDYKTKDQFVKASLIYKEKMNNATGGQSILMDGWRLSKDAFNCLNNYFNNIKDTKILGTEIEGVYSKEVEDKNREIFLQVIKHEYEKHKELTEPIKEMAYEIITTQIPANPSIVNELRSFNKEDKELVKDTMRFRQRGRR